MQDLQASYTLKDIQSDPLAFLQKLCREHGNVVKYYVEGRPCIMLNSPDYIKHVLQDTSGKYAKAGTPEMQMLKPILGDGLLTSEGALWKRQRSAARPAFTSDKILTYADRIIEATRKLVSKWPALAAADGWIDIEEEMSKLTLNVVSAALFGASLGEQAEEFGKAVHTINKYMGHFDPTDKKGLAEFRSAMMFFKRTVADIVKQRLIRKSKTGDFLDDLISFYDSDDAGDIQEGNLSDEIFTFLMAGHETTAKSLTWALYLLSKNPTQRFLAENEIDRVTKDGPLNAERSRQLPHVWCCLQEAMRLYPPVWVISRMATVKDNIKGLEINKGDLIVVLPYQMHRSPEFWPDPELFQPERFAGDARKNKPYYSYFPFGGGPRHCIGRHFASLEMILISGIIMQYFRMDVAPGQDVIPEALVTLRPKYGMKMTMTQRKKTQHV